MINETFLIKLAASVNPYLTAYATYKQSMDICRKITNGIKSIGKRKCYDLNEIMKEYSIGQISHGDLIEVEGYLLRYGQIFKPYTHIYGMFGECKKGKSEKTLINGKIMTYNSMNFETKLFYPPVQKIPNFDSYGCAFLYPESFKGFTYEANTNKATSKEKPIIINDSTKPMFIIYDHIKYEKFINKKVVLKAKVIKLPFDLARELNGVFDSSIKDICSNYIDLHSEDNNFLCLLLAGEDTSAYIENNNIEIPIKAPLYLEANLNGFDKVSESKRANFVQSLLRNVPQRIDANFPITVANTDNNIGKAFISTDDINIVYRDPSVIGFYTTTELFNPEYYKGKLETLSKVYNNFSIDYRNKMNKNFGQKDEVSMNFIFDYEKIPLFDERGILYPSEINNVMNYDNTKYIQTWLQGK